MGRKLFFLLLSVILGVCHVSAMASDFNNLTPTQSPRIFIPLTSPTIYEKPGLQNTLVVPCKANRNLNENQVELWSHESEWMSELPSYFTYDPRIGFTLMKTSWKTLEHHMFLYCVYKEQSGAEFWESYRNPHFNESYQVVWDDISSYNYIGMQLNATCIVQADPESTSSQPDKTMAIDCPRCKNSTMIFEQKYNTRKLTAVFNNIKMADAGKYTCQLLKNGLPLKEATVNVEIFETQKQIHLEEISPKELTIKVGETIDLFVIYRIYYQPYLTANATWTKKYLKIGNVKLTDSGIKQETVEDITDLTSLAKQDTLYFITIKDYLLIENAKLTDSGTYTLNVSIHDLHRSFTFKVNVESERFEVTISIPTPPKDTIDSRKYYAALSQMIVECRVPSLPPSLANPPVRIQLSSRILPKSEWRLEPDETPTIGSHETVAYYLILVREEQEFRCSAKREKREATHMLKIHVADGKPTAKYTKIQSDAGLPGEKDDEIYEGDSVELSCIHPLRSNMEAVWSHNNQNVSSEMITTASNGVNRRVNILLKNVIATASDAYSCLIHTKNQNVPLVLTVPFNVLKTERPTLTLRSKDDSTIKLDYGQPASINCPLDGIPTPQYLWLKDGELYSTIIPTSENGTLHIPRVTIEDQGVFTCKATNRVGSEKVDFKTTVIGSPTNLNKFHIIGGICIALFVAFFIAYLIYKVCKERRTNQHHVKALDTLYNQLMGQLPTHGLTSKGSGVPLDQRLAEVGYDRKYELDKERLYVGEHIGAGIFGKVCAGALVKHNDYSDEQQGIPVAIKQPLNGNNPEHQSMLIQELKLMSALGTHPNVIALLGAVTTNMRLGELHVVVEFCAHGNLKDYIKLRKVNFINELRYQELKRDGAMQYESESPYINSSDVPSVETDYLLPTSYTLSTSDLLSFAMQIAKGMEYLASIPCVHRDLALRNVLVTSDKIIRVADFGLARNIDKAYYRQQRKGKKNIPLPLRWMPIEAIEHGMYTVASDVWSYGIVLYELFSLGATPYPSITNEDLVERIKSGYRNPKPQYIHEEIFQLMNQCCKEEEKKRPDFATCVEITRNHLQRCNSGLLKHIEEEILKEADRQQLLAEWARQPESQEPRPNSFVQIPEAVPPSPKKSFLDKLLKN